MPRTGWLCSIAIFWGSTLLFLVEPMAGKRLTPLLGGSAAVWTTCLVFFQTWLLLGYLCAHGVASRLRPRVQGLVFMMLLVGSLVQVTFNLNPRLHSSTKHPIYSVFWMLTSLIGLPFLTLSTSSPLLQSWYARGFADGAAGGTAATRPPYRLFALSNFGSLLGLVFYPWLVEPRFTLHSQAVAWLGGFVLFAAICASILWRLLQSSAESMVSAPLVWEERAPAPTPTPPGSRDRVLWLLLAACGSLMLCAVTNHISKNIAAIPLLWILPLTIYLLTLVLAFSGGERSQELISIRVPGTGMGLGRMVLMCLLALALLSVGWVIYDVNLGLQFYVSITFFCLVLFISCLFCHSELHRLRPAPQYATSYYLLIAAGGALGAMFVGVVAPAVFSANYELACGLVLMAVLATAVSMRLPAGWRVFWSAATMAMITVVYFQVRHNAHDAIFQTRNFYGTLRVEETLIPPNVGPTRTLYNGMIKHGAQILTDELRHEPTAYYTRDSGVGLALDYCCGARPRRVGVIGLGVGTIAAYGRPGDVIRFYEINPQMEPIARKFFSYLADSTAAIEVVNGDARVSLTRERPQDYDVLVVDAFSGDAIPVHLLTREAIALYLRHLKPDGILAVHVSNNYLALRPLVLLQTQQVGLQAIAVSVEDKEEEGREVYGSDWVLATANRAFLSLPEVADRAEEITPLAGLRLWTDDYNSLLPLLSFDTSKWFTRYDSQ